ncbi:hypothetical protein SprV_0401397400 [Sparganum proliferum]
MTSPGAAGDKPHEDPNSLLTTVPEADMLIILGDFNVPAQKMLSGEDCCVPMVSTAPRTMACSFYEPAQNTGSF